MEIFLSASRKTENHGEIAFLHTFGGNPQETARMVRNIFFADFGRFIVLPGIDTENREVTGVARPHPVVGVASELSDRRRRSTDQTHVPELLVDEKEVLVAIVHRFDTGLETLPCSFGFLADDVRIVLHDRIPPGFGHRAFSESGKDSLGHILHPLENLHGQTRIGQLLVPAHRPETILEVVMFDTRMALYLGISAMMIGEQKTVRGDDFARATSAEEHDCILQGGLIDTVDVLGAELESLGLHVTYSLADKGWKPHSVIRPGDAQGQHQKRTDCHKEVFSHVHD